MCADALADVSEGVGRPAFEHEVEHRYLVDGNVCNAHSHGPSSAFDCASHGMWFLPVGGRASSLVKVQLVTVPGKWAGWSVARGGIDLWCCCCDVGPLVSSCDGGCGSCLRWLGCCRWGSLRIVVRVASDYW